MIKAIIATLILVSFPLLSRADMGIYEGMSISANVDVSLNDPETVNVNSSSTVNTNNKINTLSTSSAQVEVENDGFFRKMINWFKSWFR